MYRNRLRDWLQWLPDKVLAVLLLALAFKMFSTRDGHSKADAADDDERWGKLEKRLGDRITALDAVALERGKIIEAHGKSIETYKWIFSIAGAVVGFVSVFGGFHISKVDGLVAKMTQTDKERQQSDMERKESDMQRQIKDREISEKYEQAIADNKATENVVRRSVIARILRDLDGTIDLFGNLPTDALSVQLKETIQRMTDELTMLEEAYGFDNRHVKTDPGADHQLNAERSLVALLKDACGCLRQASVVFRMKEGDQSETFKRELALLETTWTNFKNTRLPPVLAKVSEGQKVYLKRLSAYSHYFMALIHWRRYTSFPETWRKELGLGIDDIRAAQADYSTFGRAIMMEAVLLAERGRKAANAESGGSVPGTAIADIELSLQRISEANSHVYDERILSVNDNNAAVIAYGFARILRPSEKPDAAEKMLSKAADFLASAKKRAVVDPVIYSTEAELECVRIEFSEKAWRQTPDHIRSEWLAHLIALFKRTKEVQSNFPGKLDTLIELYPVVGNLRILDPDWTILFKKALNLE